MVRAAIGDAVADVVGGGELGPVAVLGRLAGDLVSDLLAVPQVQQALAALPVVFSELFTPGVVDAVAAVAGAVAAGQLSRDAAVQQLEGDAAVQQAVQAVLVTGVQELLGDDALWQAVGAQVMVWAQQLPTDTFLLTTIQNEVATGVREQLGGPLGEVAGPLVGQAVSGLLADPGVVEGLAQGLITLIGTFRADTGAVDAVAQAAGAGAAAFLATAVLFGADPLKAAEQAAGQVLANSAGFAGGVSGSVTAAVRVVLGNTALWSAVDTQVSELVSGLLAAPVVRAAIGDAVANVVNTQFGLGPISFVGEQVGAAVEQFLATPGVASGLGAVIGSIVPDFLGQAGVPGVLAGVAGQFAAAVLAGEDPLVAWGAALDALKTSTVVQAALKATIADTLNLVNTDLLSVPSIQQEIGSIATELITELADSPAVRTYIADALGSPLGPVVAKLLADPALVDAAAGVLGSAVTQLLSYPGFRSGLTGAINQFADAVLDGKTTQEALQVALKWLQADPAFMTAVDAVVPTVLNALLSYAKVRQAIGEAIKQETIARLKESGINNAFLDGVAGQVAGGTVDSFLGTRAGERLVDDVVLNVLAGMPFNDVTNYATQQVIHDPLLQIALGMSIGQGIGSLFGDNIVGHFIGFVAGVPITIVVVATAGVVSLYQWIFGEPNLSAGQSAQALPDGSHFFQPLAAASDSYVMNAILPDWQATAASMEGILANAQYTLTSMAIAEPHGEQPRSLDLTMTLGADESQNGGSLPELQIAVRFRTDRLPMPAAPSSSDIREARFS